MRVPADVLTNRRGLLMLVAAILLVLLAGYFFRDPGSVGEPSTPSATESSSAPGAASSSAPDSSAPGSTAPASAARTSTAGRASTSSVPSTDADGLAVIAVADLPAEAQEVYRLLMASGPFEYQKDGTVFGNREGLLPSKPNGYYREFTVETPGSRDRGARRFVVGGCGKQTSTTPVRATACSTSHPIYYTDDHYESFRRVL
ncbi:ribonuclease domain-containing protein [Propionibacteriaceae bacterium Y1923]|uniref:ribonuclease domain-containing protein n=1 Tax=Aestuariimicrobium sp. Y1814 TaxID=3418742 RepID=UPI003C1AA884